jgi:hypothetical protein
MTEKSYGSKNKHVPSTTSFIVALLLLLSPAPPGMAEELKPGPDTTVLSEPLRADGSIDYVRGMDQQLGSWVTRENNFAVRLLEALGPETIPASIRERYFSRLGLPIPPLGGDYFQSIKRAFAAKVGLAAKVESQLHKAKSRPWTSNEFPELAEWLSLNEKPLKVVAEASQMPESYIPVVGEDGAKLSSVLLPIHQDARELVMGLGARALLNVAAGNIDRALDDCETSLRLGLHLGSTPVIVSQLVVVACMATTATVIDSIAQTGKLTPQDVNRLRKALLSAPKLKSGNVFLFGERYMLIESALGEIPNLVDKNEVLRAFNDAMEAIAAMYLVEDCPTPRMVNEELIRVETDPNPDSNLEDPRRLKASRNYGWSMAYAHFYAGEPGKVFVEAHCRMKIRFRLLVLVCGLAEYRAMNGTFPNSLNDLVPRYVDQIPIDPYSPDGHPLRYIVLPTRQNYVIYSVGKNGKDEQGRADYDEATPEDEDDVALGEPLPRSPQPSSRTEAGN